MMRSMVRFVVRRRNDRKLRMAAMRPERLPYASCRDVGLTAAEFFLDGRTRFLRR